MRRVCLKFAAEDMATVPRLAKLRPAHFATVNNDMSSGNKLEYNIVTYSLTEKHDHDLHSVGYSTRVHWTSNFLQGIRNTRTL